ncbi:MAG TPA: tetratricopeptide repeat protein [Nocardioidaceae bacterium]|nr:tetratricopeptide repeat protein [Nocardioidaceae bacterium]
MRTKITVAVLVVVLVFYAVLIGAKGVALLGSGSAVGVVLGAGLLVIPLVGVWLVWREITFGRRSAELAAVLDEEGGLPVDDLPRRPSGRVDRAAADEAFAERRTETAATPDSWRGWYRLALAYDDAGDRTRARAAVRHAIELFDRDRRSA